MYRPQACFSVGIGLGVELVGEAKVQNLGRKPTKFSTSFQLGLDTPKIETCIKETEGVFYVRIVRLAAYIDVLMGFLYRCQCKMSSRKYETRC
jgi:hypothetical protein